MTFTLVSFHAHPDDEALLTGGTLARAAAEGHRVVLVVATAGEAGLAADRYGDAATLGARRREELRRSAAALGCARVELLGYADSGLGAGADGFAALPVEEPAARLARILQEEQADVLTVYDPAGGYGHPDHRQVHLVGVRAAELAGTPVVLEATVDRARLVRLLRLLHRARRLVRLPAEFAPDRFAAASYSPPDRLTHEVDVTRHLRQKRAAMGAHVSQASADDADRTLAVCLRLPGPLFRLAFRREWFVERGRAPARPLLDDVFASVRSASR